MDGSLMWKYEMEMRLHYDINMWSNTTIKNKWKHWITNKSAGGDWVWGMRREDRLWSRWNCTGCRWPSSTSSLYKIIEESEEKQMIFEVADAWESPTHIFHQQCFNQTQNWYFSKHFFSFSGLDQNLVTAASYMVPTKYTKYAKQVGDITLSSYDDIKWCTSWFYYKAQK